MKAFVINLERCNGCRNCQIACKDEHVGNEWLPYAMPEPDTGQFWCKVDEEVAGQVPHVRVNFRSHLCNHCDEAPCIAACAYDAFEKREDGLVVLLPQKCTGCRACVAACPYDAIFFNDELNIAQKCTGCAHLLDDGWAEPRCVDACCTGALMFGEEEELQDLIAQSEPSAQDECTRPRVHYLNDPKTFVAGTVVDTENDEVLIGAEVRLLDVEGNPVAATTTDDFGNFWFKRLPAGEYQVACGNVGYLDRSLSASTVDGSRSLGVISLFQTPFDSSAILSGFGLPVST